MIHKFGRFRVKKEKLADAVASIEEFVDNVARREGGVVMYRAFQDKDDPTRFTHYMIFRTKSAEDNHQKTAWMKAFVAALYPLCSEVPTFADLQVIGERN